MRQEHAGIPAAHACTRHRDRGRSGSGPGYKLSWEGAGSLTQWVLWEHRDLAWRQRAGSREGMSGQQGGAGADSEPFG